MDILYKTLVNSQGNNIWWLKIIDVTKTMDAKYIFNESRVGFDSNSISVWIRCLLASFSWKAHFIGLASSCKGHRWLCLKILRKWSIFVLWKINIAPRKISFKWSIIDCWCFQIIKTEVTPFRHNMMHYITFVPASRITLKQLLRLCRCFLKLSSISKLEAALLYSHLMWVRCHYCGPPQIAVKISRCWNIYLTRPTPYLANRDFAWNFFGVDFVLFQ